MKWTKDFRYFGRDEQVDAYDRGEVVYWENEYGGPEVVNIQSRAREETEEGTR